MESDSAGPIQAKQARRVEADAQTFEEICLRPRRFAIIQRRGSCPGDRALPRARAMDEQSSREFASADAAAGAHDTVVQERRLSAEIPVNACGGPQHLQR